MDYDYIVVGAGSAGCVLADRLSESGHAKVLVLEAGGSDARFWIKVPLGYGFTYSDPRVNWRYTAEPDPGLDGREAYWPRGRVVGGSSSINAMAYVRGLAHDFDDWERAGATDWNWRNVRAVYERLERHHETSADGNTRVRGDGPVSVSDLRSEMHPFSSRFLDAARDLGWPTIEDMNGNVAEGLSCFRSTVKDGRRWSTADAFLRPALKRDNVRLVTDALVERLEIGDGRATGVTYRLGDRRVTRAPKAPDISAMDEAQMLDNFRSRAISNYHPSCTCRMGRDASDSVLDARLRVHGVRGLRVVDAAAFPNVTSGNTNAPTMMLALRAADLILEDTGTEPHS